MRTIITLLLALLAMQSLSAQTTKKGDANGDGKVTITDAVAIVNYILGNPSGNFDKVAANVSGDLDDLGEPKITITDAVGVVNIILQGTGKPRLVVLLKNGQKDYYDLSDTPVTTFNNGQLVITTASTEVSYPLADVQRYEYEGVSNDIAELAPEKGTDVHVFRDGNTLTLTHVQEGATVSLYGSDGQLLETITGKGKPVLISVDSRPDGVYLVKTSNQTFKLIKQ